MFIKPISLLKTKIYFKIDLNIVVISIVGACDVYVFLRKTNLFSTFLTEMLKLK